MACLLHNVHPYRSTTIGMQIEDIVITKITLIDYWTAAS